MILRTMAIELSVIRAIALPISCVHSHEEGQLDSSVQVCSGRRELFVLKLSCKTLFSRISNWVLACNTFKYSTCMLQKGNALEVKFWTHRVLLLEKNESSWFDEDRAAYHLCPFKRVQPYDLPTLCPASHCILLCCKKTIALYWRGWAVWKVNLVFVIFRTFY